MNLKRRARELAEALENVHFRKFDPKENRWEEVNVLILAALESVQAETRDATLREAADAVDNGTMRDNPASTIRALIAAPAPPDPLLVALAGLFAAWWKTPPAQWNLEAASKSGLIHPVDAGEYALTDLGRTVITLAGESDPCQP